MKNKIVVLAVDDIMSNDTFMFHLTEEPNKYNGTLILTSAESGKKSTSLEDTGDGYKFIYFYGNGNKPKVSFLYYDEIQELAALYKLIEDVEQKVIVFEGEENDS